jgi:hypothetical protein
MTSGRRAATALAIWRAARPEKLRLVPVPAARSLVVRPEKR